ncbi:MAG: hypothetical protein IKF79_06335 [Methanosphaera sp.]|nr:hypothetical protein [Methanosphaera sp.]
MRVELAVAVYFPKAQFVIVVPECLINCRFCHGKQQFVINNICSGT